MANDPTYNRDEINANQEWELAFTLSEIENDNAPIGWSRYLLTAQLLLHHYEIKRRPGTAV